MITRDQQRDENNDENNDDDITPRRQRQNDKLFYTQQQVPGARYVASRAKKKDIANKQNDRENAEGNRQTIQT
jgi:hypothetical protein